MFVRRIQPGVGIGAFRCGEAEAVTGLRRRGQKGLKMAAGAVCGDIRGPHAGGDDALVSLGGGIDMGLEAPMRADDDFAEFGMLLSEAGRTLKK